MNPIVFDLEWNVAGYKNRVSAEVRHQLPFEIMEIGALRLDEGLREIERFEARVRPTHYRKLSKYVAHVTGREADSLLEGERFPDVARRFLDFVGPAPLFLSWSPADPLVLRQNLAFFSLPVTFPWRTLDVQRYFAHRVENDDLSQQRSVETALAMLELAPADSLHTALSDAGATTRILRRIADGGLWDYQTELAPQKSYERRFPLPADPQKVGQEWQQKALPCPVCSRPLRADGPFRGSLNRKLKRLLACPLHGLMREEIIVQRALSALLLRRTFLFQGAGFLLPRSEAEEAAHVTSRQARSTVQEGQLDEKQESDNLPAQGLH